MSESESESAKLKKVKLQKLVNTKTGELVLSVDVTDLCDLVEDGSLRVRFADRADVILNLKDVTVEELEDLAKAAEDAADDLRDDEDGEDGEDDADGLDLDDDGEDDEDDDEEEDDAPEEQ